MKITLTVAGIVVGCIVGYFSAHYFALWGGFALFGVPHSPARNALVPGHVLFFGCALGAAGFVAGHFLSKKDRKCQSSKD